MEKWQCRSKQCWLIEKAIYVQIKKLIRSCNLRNHFATIIELTPSAIDVYLHFIHSRSDNGFTPRAGIFSAPIFWEYALGNKYYVRLYPNRDMTACAGYISWNNPMVNVRSWLQSINFSLLTGITPVTGNNAFRIYITWILVNNRKKNGGWKRQAEHDQGKNYWTR